MKIILNDHKGSLTFADALKELVADADTLSVAVSYLQVSGWQMFHAQTRELSLARMRIVCTDQLGITQPAAVSRAIASGVQIRNYAGRATCHPKVYLAHDKIGRPTRFLLGSANLSYSAFMNSVEAGVLSEDTAGLGTLKDWFDDLFKRRSEEFTAESLRQMEMKWREAAVHRAKARLDVRRKLVVTPRAIAPTITAEDLDTLEDVFATLQTPIGLLCLDYSGNTVRNISRARELLNDWSRLSTLSGGTVNKHKSELKNLGLTDGRKLTPLGEAAAKASSNAGFARLWCEWLHNIPDAKLAEIRPELFTAKRVFTQFWKLQTDVQDYFLQYSEGAQKHTATRLVLNTIELLCNATAVVQTFTLVDFEALAPLLTQADRIPINVREDVVDYLENKGTRTWDSADRRLILEAWKKAAGL